jgi:hypothetical protein
MGRWWVLFVAIVIAGLAWPISQPYGPVVQEQVRVVRHNFSPGGVMLPPGSVPILDDDEYYVWVQIRDLHHRVKVSRQQYHGVSDGSLVTVCYRRTRELIFLKAYPSSNLRFTCFG